MEELDILTGMRVISLFSGCGGLDYGFKEAGCDIVWANDIDNHAALTYEENLGNEMVTGDIAIISTDDIPSAELVIGGFPCLGFTIANLKRNINDEQNYLYLEFLRVVKAKAPRLFLIENVPGMKSLANGELFGEMVRRFSDTGYRVNHVVLNAADFGVPQTRKRVFVFGVREDCDMQLEIPQSTHSRNGNSTIEGTRLRKWVSLKEAIADLPEPSEDSNEIQNHMGTSHKVKITGYVGNRKLEWNVPSPTITGRGSRTGGPVIHPHPDLHRRLTVRECARLQSFPDNFILHGSVSSQYAQVGNAVPPLLAFSLARSLMKASGGSPKGLKNERWNLPWFKESETWK